MNGIDWFRLTKLPLSLLISLSALFGYAQGTSRLSLEVSALVFGGTLLIVFAGAVLNNVQDIALDTRMERTRVRPLPMGRISISGAVIAALLFACGGFFLLSQTPQPLWVVGTGALGLLIYNGLYTPLKKRSTLALFPGAVCGACPPAMGWFAAGRHADEWGFVVLTALLFFWQIPHFWLILLRRHEDYGRAGVPHMLQLLSQAQLARICVAWVVSFALIASLLASSPAVQSNATRGLIVLVSVGLALSPLVLLKQRTPQTVKRSFIQLNAALGILMLVTIFDRALAAILHP